MTIIVQGCGTGEIQINLAHYNLPSSMQNQLMLEVYRGKEANSVEIDDGRLLVKADLQQLEGEDLRQALARLENNIVEMIDNLVVNAASVTTTSQ